jgi:hypothetical protein
MYSKDIENAVKAKIHELGGPIAISEREFPFEFITVGCDNVLIEVYKEKSWYEIYAMVFVRQSIYCDIDEFKAGFDIVKKTPKHPIYGFNFKSAPVYDYWFSVEIDNSEEFQDAKMGLQELNLQYNALMDICVKNDIELVQSVVNNVTGIYENRGQTMPYGACCTIYGINKLLTVKAVADMYRRGHLPKYLEIIKEAI